MGFLNNVLPFSLIFWGQTHIASGLASILNATTPLFTVVVAHVLTADEKMTGSKIMALLVGFAGVALLVGPDSLARPSQVCGVSWPVWARPFPMPSPASTAGVSRPWASRRWRPRPGKVTASSVLILPIMLVVDRPWALAALPSPTVWGALVGLALLSTALGYVLYFRILAAAGATNLLLVTFLMPVIAILLGGFFLGERLEPRHFAGMALIGVGLAVIDGRIAGVLRPAK